MMIDKKNIQILTKNIRNVGTMGNPMIGSPGAQSSIISYIQTGDKLYMAEYRFGSASPFFDSIEYALTDKKNLFKKDNYKIIEGRYIIGSKKPESLLKLILGKENPIVTDFVKGYEPVFMDTGKEILPSESGEKIVEAKCLTDHLVF